MQLYTKILLGMAIGVVLGLLVGPNSALLPHTVVQFADDPQISQSNETNAPRAAYSEGLKKATLLAESTDPQWLKIQWRFRSADVLRWQRRVKGTPAASRPSPLKGTVYEGWVRLPQTGVSTSSGLGQSLVDATSWIGQLFLAMIKMVVVPLVFFSLTVGVASLGDLRRLGKLGGRTLGLFTGTTVAALVVGMTLANFLTPGALLSTEDRQRLLSAYEGAADRTADSAADAPSLMDQLVGVVPSNPIASLAEGQMLQIIFFAVLFGVALTLLDKQRSAPLVATLDTANEAMVMLVHIAMKLAPVGVAALLFKVVGTTGISVLFALSLYAAVVVLGLVAHLVLTYGTIVRFGAGLPFVGFLRAIRPALLVAFSTSSSSATLPVTKECLEDNLNVSGSVSSFVVPLGATINMDGTALYQGVAALFIAQIYGMPLTLTDQLTIVTSATLASVGAAGVPGAGMITLAMVLTSIGIPTEGLALVLGVDRLLDMFRTSVNVVGDSAVTVLMGRLEGDPVGIVRAKT